MTEKDQNKTPDQNQHNDGDDLESLSSDEMAAFEKIMSQIEDTESADIQEPPKPAAKTESADEALNDDQADGADTEPTDDSGDESLTDDQQAALDKIMSDINGDDDNQADQADTEPAADSGDESLTDDQQAALDKIMSDIKSDDDNQADQAGTEPAADSDDESLTDDQQAALDKIMSDINGDDDDQADQAGTEPAADSDDESLTDDQQAALDKIMSEIKSDDDDKADQAGTEPAADSGDESLTDDQQAALDKIMSEIKSDDDDKADQAGTEPAADSGDESLTDDQQAALDKIVSEIKSDDDDQADQPDTEPAADSDDESLTDDQQAALDKIMSEINENEDEDDAVKPEEAVSESGDDQQVTKEQQEVLEKIASEINDRENDERPEPPPDAAGPAEKEKNPPSDDESLESSIPESENVPNEELSLDEFNNELNNLLGTGKEQNTSEAAPSPGPVTANDSQASNTDQGYAMLQEVDDGNARPVHSQKKKSKSRFDLRPQMGRSTLIKGAVALSLVLILTGASYWGYHHWFNTPRSEQASIPDNQDQQMPAPAPLVPPAPEPMAEPSLPAVESPEGIDPERHDKPFALIRSDLGSAREQLQKKIDEIKELKAYYRNGIDEEQQNLVSRTAKMGKPTFKKAIRDSRVELSLQAIQRRSIYIAKLDSPLKHLATLSEKLLYLERRTRMLETLSSGISGLPVSDLKQDVADTIKEQMEKSAQLSIDQVKVPTPSLASIWNDFRQSKPIAGAEDGRQKIDHVLNRKIADEVCKGDYSRKYLMTAMDAKTAGCLSQWPGKDLYLNNLTVLTPGVAKALAQWPGEWLSLNSVRTITADTAKHLSQWTGRRISLNGLSTLSAEATIHLSKWQGEQLEMVGLTSIGRWENYGTRLYLSEALKRKLKMP